MFKVNQFTTTFFNTGKLFKHHSRFKSSFPKIPTIFALSSGQGRCGVAVIRISGPDAGKTLKQLTRTESLPKPRYAHLKSISNPNTYEVLDRGLVLWFPGPKSFTGEDCCELQVHGGPAVISAVLRALATVPNLRLAEPGEFTKRAFYNGKLDLTEVEGIGDLLAAETEIQRKQAFLQTEGFLSKLYKRWRDVLVRCLANVEAHIDFDESEGLESGIVETTRCDVERLAGELRQHLDDNRRGEIVRDGVKTVIVGEPNVGKSSLFNLLCSQPAAIVTPFEGTTRDVLEKTLDIGGYPLLLADTAGLRHKTNDLIEKEGISRTFSALKTAQLVLLVVDCSKYLMWQHANPSLKFLSFIEQYLKRLKIHEDILDESGFKKRTVIIVNKCDLSVDSPPEILDPNVSLISCTSNLGISSLIENIKEKLVELCGEPSSEHPSVCQARHRQHLTDCLNCLQEFLNSERDVVFLAEDLRKALRHLGKITGEVSTDALLDVIFREFCIGK